MTIAASLFWEIVFVGENDPNSHHLETWFQLFNFLLEINSGKFLVLTLQIKLTKNYHDLICLNYFEIIEYAW
jgi:hypothetical protein